MHRYAALDIGSNSVKMLVADRVRGGGWHCVADEMEITRLGGDMQQDGKLDPEACARTAGAIARLVRSARKAGAREIAAAGTMVLRKAADAPEFCERVRRESGIEIEVIDGEREARLAFQAAVALPGSGPRAVVDVGGGSTEFAFGNGQILEKLVSLDIGAVGMTETLAGRDHVTAEQLERMLAVIRAAFAELPVHRTGIGVIGVGGTVTTMAAVQYYVHPYDAAAIHGASLSREQIDRQLLRYRTSNLAVRREIVGMEPGRADIIIAGCAIVSACLDRLAADRLLVSDRGLRHGLLAEAFA